MKFIIARLAPDAIAARIRTGSRPQRRRSTHNRLHGETLESRELMSITNSIGSGALSRVGQQNQDQADANRQSREGVHSQAPSRPGIVNNISGGTGRPYVGSQALSPIGQQSLDFDDQISEAASFDYIFGTESKNATIDKSTDVDMYKINVLAGERLTFDIDSRNGLDSYIRLFNSRGQQIAFNDDGTAAGESSSYESFLDYTFALGGTFYIGVSGYGNSQYNAVTGLSDGGGATGGYSLNISEATTSGPPSTRFDSESNNSISSANNIGSFGGGYHSQTFYGSTGAGSDTEDWTRFELEGSASGTIQLSGMYQDLDVALYDSTGRVVASSVNYGTRTDTINLSSLRAGTYYLQIRPGTTGARSAYALRFGLRVS